VCGQAFLRAAESDEEVPAGDATEAVLAAAPADTARLVLHTAGQRSSVNSAPPPVETGKTYRLWVRVYSNPVQAQETIDRLTEAGLKPVSEQESGLYRVVLAGVAPDAMRETTQKLTAAGFPGTLVAIADWNPAKEAEKETESIIVEIESENAAEQPGNRVTESELRSSVEEIEPLVPYYSAKNVHETANPSNVAAEASGRKGFTPRVFEWGIINVDVSVANNWMCWKDIFNPESAVTIDLDKLPHAAFGLIASVEPQTWFKFRSKGKNEIGVAVTAGLDIDAYAGFSSELTKQLAGEISTTPFSGAVESGASAFFTLEAKGSAKIGKWRFFAAPELYIPLLYMEKPDIHAYLNTQEEIEIQGETKKVIAGEVVVMGGIYSPFDNLKSPDFSDISGLLNFTGVNLSLGVEYPLFKFLDVSGSISHIPLVPAKMTKKTSFNIAYDINPDGSGLLDAFDNFFQGREGSSLAPESGEGSLDVYRPLRFDAYCVYKPFNFRTVNIAFRGNMGYSMWTVYGDCFNFGISARADWMNMFGLELKTGRAETLWQHGASLMINIRGLELDFGVAVQSQDFVKSFEAAGIQAAFGLKVGF